MFSILERHGAQCAGCAQAIPNSSDFHFHFLGHRLFERIDNTWITMKQVAMKLEQNWFPCLPCPITCWLVLPSQKKWMAKLVKSPRRKDIPRFSAGFVDQITRLVPAVPGRLRCLAARAGRAAWRLPGGTSCRCRDRGSPSYGNFNEEKYWKKMINHQFSQNSQTMPCLVIAQQGLKWWGMQRHKQTIATRPVWVFAQMYFAAQLALREKEPPPPASRPVPECFRFVANFSSRGWGNQQSTVWYWKLLRLTAEAGILPLRRLRFNAGPETEARGHHAWNRTWPFRALVPDTPESTWLGGGETIVICNTVIWCISVFGGSDVYS